MNRKLAFPFFGAGIALIALIFFKSKKAKAEEKGKELPDIVIPVANAPTNTAKTDPATGVRVAGPSGSISTSGGVTPYVVAKGESWSNIASRAYGDYRWWPAIWDMNYFPALATGNEGPLANPDVLRVGTQITLLPAQSPVFANEDYKAAIFERSDEHRNWWLNKLKKGSRPRPFPPSVLAHTDPSKYFTAPAAPAPAPAQGSS